MNLPDPVWRTLVKPVAKRKHKRATYNPATHVSMHYSWDEVVKPNSGYTRPLPAIIKLPNGQSFNPRKNARKHALNLELLRAAVNKERRKRSLKATGINTISWARSWAHNKAVGGASNSGHLYFWATDISLQEIDRLFPWKGGRSDFDRIASRIFAKGGFGTYPAGNRHVDSRGYFARWSDWTPAT